MSKLAPEGAPASGDDDVFTGTHHVYVPFRAGLPPMGPYFREVWRRRAFAIEMARATRRAANTNTVLGGLWTVLNPLLLGLVYFFLVFILRGGSSGPPEYFSHMLCGLFVFYFISNSMTAGSTSITSAGKVITNMAFPRLLLPISAVRGAFGKFAATLFVLIPVLAIGPVKFSPVVLVAVVWFVFVLMFALGMATLLATASVYFRDTSSFLPYVTRIWLYTSPVLWFPDMVPAKLKAIEFVNPLFSVVGGWSEIIIQHRIPPLSLWISAAVWSTLALVAGTLTFVARERDLAVRL